MEGEVEFEPVLVGGDELRYGARLGLRVGRRAAVGDGTRPSTAAVGVVRLTVGCARQGEAVGSLLTYMSYVQSRTSEMWGRGAVALTVGSAPREIVPELRHFHWLLKMNNQSN